MSTKAVLTALACALTGASMLAGCGDDSPSRVTGPGSPSPGQTAATLRRIELTGPTTVNIGETASYTLTAFMSDDTTRNVTGQANWSANSNLLSAVGPGQFTGRQKGETSVRANYSGQTSVIGTVIVVPPGTYRLSGVVRDEGLPVLDASIVVENSALGLTSIVTSDGTYKVFGVAGPTRITASKNGYQTIVRDQVISSHETVNFDMALSRPRDDLSGRYTLTFTAAGECSTLPEEARVRSYQATVSQSGPRLQVTVDGGQFFNGDGRPHNSFTGTVEPSAARFTLTYTWFDYYYFFYYFPDIFERLPSELYLGIEGGTLASISGSGMSGQFDGWIGVYQLTSPYRAVVRCRSRNHRLSLVR